MPIITIDINTDFELNPPKWGGKCDKKGVAQIDDCDKSDPIKGVLYE